MFKRFATTIVLLGCIFALANCAAKLESGKTSNSSTSTPDPTPTPTPTPTPSPQPSDFTASAADVTVAPGTAAAVNFVISKALSSPLVINYQTADDTAVAGSHYLATQGSATVATGATSVSVSVPTTNSMATDYSGKRFKITFSIPGSTVAAVTSFISFNVVPSKVTGLVATGTYHSCSIKGAALYCFGLGTSGQLGNGAAGNTNVPTLVASMDSGVTDVEAGNNTTCAIKNGALYCWGQNDYYQIGDGSAVASTFPRAVFDMASGVTAVSAGFGHTCAVKAGGLYCWGRNDYAQVGHNNGTQQVPYRVPGFETGVTSVAAGYLHTCAIKNGALFCWGYNGLGELGIGNVTINNARNPTAMALPAIVGLDSGVTQVSSGGQAVCAVKAGALYCWGYNGYGQLGLGSTASNSAPQLINGFDANVTSVATSQSHTCAVKNGSAYCWGANNYGQLGYNDVVQRLAPSAVPVTLTLPAGEKFISVSVSSNLVTTGNIESSCARTSANKVFCWGYNGYGQTGVAAATASVLVPTAIPLFN